MLSIIIPTYNEYKNLSILLPFLLNEVTDHRDIIIVDAGKSTDNLSHICDLPGVLYIKSQYTQRASQLNEGTKYAKHKNLFFLHADVMPAKGFTLAINQALQNVDFGSFSYRFDSDRKLLKINSFFTRKEGMFSGGGDQGLFINKSTFYKMGCYDESCKIMEDFDFYKRCKSHGLQYKILNMDATVSARKYENNSYFRVNVFQGIVFLKYWLGHSQDNIQAYYNKWIH